MRVSQGWAGSGYGMFTIPRVGHEVAPRGRQRGEEPGRARAQRRRYVLPAQGAPDPNALGAAHRQMLQNTAKGIEPLSGVSPIPAAAPGAMPGWKGIKEHVADLRSQLKSHWNENTPANGAELLAKLDPIAWYGK
jgi:hypothetical protein